MATLYKPNIFARIVFCIFFLLPVAAQAQESLFTVEGVSVDVTADNAIQARDEAFAKAQGDAFKILAERMLTASELESFTAPEASTISPMISDYEVTNEKLSAVRYIGTYTFRFQEKAVRRYFAGSGATYTDMASKPLLILPFYQSGADMLLWKPENVWMKAWHKTESLGTLVPLVVPIGDLADVSDIDDQEAFSYEDRRMDRMMRRYNAQEAVIVVAAPDENMRLIRHASEPATGSMTVNLYRTDRNGPEHAQQMVVSAHEGENFGQMLDRAVKQIQKALREDWKQKTVVSQNTQKQTIQARVRFNNFNEWAETQRALKSVVGIEDVTLVSLSPREARVELIYSGTQNRLNMALRQADMTLSAPQQARSAQTYGNRYGYEAMPPVYDLRLNKSIRRPYSQRF